MEVLAARSILLRVHKHGGNGVRLCGSIEKVEAGSDVNGFVCGRGGWFAFALIVLCYALLWKIPMVGMVRLDYKASMVICYDKRMHCGSKSPGGQHQNSQVST